MVVCFEVIADACFAVNSESGKLPWLHTSKFLVIIVSVHSKTASKMRGTSLWTLPLSLLMMAANRLSASASLQQEQAANEIRSSL